MFNKLIEWSKKNYHTLPWRENRNLYITLVSEIMLQQTTVSTVLNRFDQFIKRFPTIVDLAKATDEQMLQAWKGLGYYRRAKNLKNAAIYIAEKFNGKFPSDKELLKEINGVGEYTASALISIGMDRKELALDANLERVLSRFYAIKENKGPALHKKIKSMFYNEQILKEFKGSYRELNEALMDLGRTICQARKANCEICPISTNCQGLKLGTPLHFPLQVKEKEKEEHELELYRFFIIKKNKILCYQKPKGTWLEGQYEVPTFIYKTTDKNLKQYPILKTKLKSRIDYVTGITKYKIKNIIIESDERLELGSTKTKWLPLDSLDLSTATIKGIKLLKKRDQV